MQFDLWSKGLASLEAECLVVGIFDEGTLTEEARAVDSASGGRLGKLVARGDFPGRSGETQLVTDLSGLKATRVLLAGLGPEKTYSRKSFRKNSDFWRAAASFTFGSKSGSELPLPSASRQSG